MFSNVTDVRPVQPSNAYLPILVTLDGMVIEVRLVQPLNTKEAMTVSWLFSSNIIDVRPVQPSNALKPMPVTLDGTVIDRSYGY